MNGSNNPKNCYGPLLTGSHRKQSSTKTVKTKYEQQRKPAVVQGEAPSSEMLEVEQGVKNMN